MYVSMCVCAGMVVHRQHEDDQGAKARLEDLIFGMMSLGGKRSMGFCASGEIGLR